MSNRFSIIKKGYNPIEVDNYIKGLEQTINEYKDKSTSINRAIINAQYAADGIIKSAHQETEKLLSEARAESEKMLKEADNTAFRIKQKNLNQIVMLKNHLTKQKNLIEDFQKDYETLSNKYLKNIETEDLNPVFDRIEELDKMIQELSAPEPVQDDVSNAGVSHETVDKTAEQGIQGMNPGSDMDAEGYDENLNVLKELVSTGEAPHMLPPDDTSPYQRLNYEELQELLPIGKTDFD